MLKIGQSLRIDASSCVSIPGAYRHGYARRRREPPPFRGVRTWLDSRSRPGIPCPRIPLPRRWPNRLPDCIPLPTIRPGYSCEGRRSLLPSSRSCRPPSAFAACSARRPPLHHVPGYVDVVVLEEDHAVPELSSWTCWTMFLMIALPAMSCGWALPAKMIWTGRSGSFRILASLFGVPEQEIPPLVGREPAGEADRQGLRVEHVFRTLDLRGQLAPAQSCSFSRLRAKAMSRSRLRSWVLQSSVSGIRSTRSQTFSLSGSSIHLGPR